MDPFFLLLEQLGAYSQLLRTPIWSFSHVQWGGINWNLTFSETLPAEQAAQIAGTFLDNWASVPWPPIRNRPGPVGRDRWVVVVTVLKVTGRPEIMVTHYGPVGNNQIPTEILASLQEGLTFYKECSPKAGTHQTA